jgi:CRISPR-associated endonuclease/helicase Cas3
MTDPAQAQERITRRAHTGRANINADGKAPSFFYKKKMKTPYAHSLDNQPEEKWQSLEQHLLAVATIAADFSKVFDACEWGRAVGLLHDLGKARQAFQDMLSGKRGKDWETRHAIYGAKAAFTNNSLPLAFAVAGHHAGLHDLADLQEAAAKADERECATLSSASQPRIQFPTETALPAPILNAAIAGDVLPLEFFTRMIFSCLIDADRLDSAFWEKMGKETINLSKPVLPLDADSLLARVSDERDRKRAKARAGALSEAQNRIFDACVAAGGQAPGFFSLTVPTGGGKTLSAMAFALAHAKAHGRRRIIVVIPYLSIIEQNAAEYRRILDPERQGIVVENHSSVKPRDNADEEANSRLELIAENWDAPIIVTTSVQFIESLFAAQPSRARKLHNIARSVVIFDEVQTLPVHLLRPILNVFRELTANYGVSFVFSSATQPAFRHGNSLPDGFRDDEITEIAPAPAELYKILRRVTYQVRPEPLDWEGLAKQLVAVPQCLCVVNLTRHARELWEVLARIFRDEYRAAGGESKPPSKQLWPIHNLRPIHLSSAMCPAHRLALLRSIRLRLKAGLPCRVVSTQLIEAGVDVDFPVVWRAMGPLDSIVQVAGRCNRQGRFTPEESVVRVFTPADDKKLPPGIYSAATQQAAVSLARLGDDAAEQLATKPEIFHDYFTQLYALAATDYDKRGEASIQEERANLHFRKVAAKAKVIQDDGRPVVIPIGKARHLIDKIRARKPGVGQPRFSRDDLRHLQRYMVNVRTNNFDILLRDTLIEPLLPNLGVFVLKTGVYHASLGLLVNARPLDDFLQ